MTSSSSSWTHHLPNKTPKLTTITTVDQEESNHIDSELSSTVNCSSDALPNNETENDIDDDDEDDEDEKNERWRKNKDSQGLQARADAVVVVIEELMVMVVDCGYGDDGHSHYSSHGGGDGGS